MQPPSFEPSFQDWLDYGVGRGWVSSPVCNTHDGLPSTPDEEEEWEAGADPCVPAIRIWADAL